MLAQYIRNKGFQEGQQEANIMFANRLLAKKYHIAPERLTPRLKGLSPEDLLELGERILECDSFEDIQRWLRQKKRTHSDS